MKFVHEKKENKNAQPNRFIDQRATTRLSRVPEAITLTVSGGSRGRSKGALCPPPPLRRKIKEERKEINKGRKEKGGQNQKRGE